jgi:hypothetical protein
MDWVFIEILLALSGENPIAPDTFALRVTAVTSDIFAFA